MQFENTIFRMKYLILLVVLIITILAKPWEISFAGGLHPMNDSTLLIASTSGIKAPLPLFPIGQVINNEDSQFSETEQFDKSIERFMRTWSIQGASFALMKDNKLLYAKGYGFADKEAGVQTDVKHIFRIASVSKLITAVGIMKLEEEGKLKLSDPVFGPDGILNDSIYSSIKDPRAKKITIENLLRHQGGFSNAYGDPMFSPVDIAKKMHVKAPADLNTIIQYALSRRLNYNPGMTTIYSNLGYGILTKVIEKISGTGYESYICQTILKPIGCFDMHLGRNLYENKLANEVKYYENATNGLIPACDGSNQLVPKYYGGNNIEELYGAGGWVASPAELLRFLASIDGNPDIPDILKPETVSLMTAFSQETLPIGWMHITADGEWWRTGTLSGTSALMKKQSDGYSWVFITNTSSWKGSKFPSYINSAVSRAFQTHVKWPEKDLFKQQQFDPHQLLVTQ